MWDNGDPVSLDYPYFQNLLGSEDSTTDLRCKRWVYLRNLSGLGGSIVSQKGGKLWQKPTMLQYKRQAPPPSAFWRW